MPKYKVRGPDDFLYEFNGPADATDDEKIAYAQHLYDQRQTQITPAAGMGEALKGGAKQFGSSVLTGLQGIISPEEAAKAGLERQAAITERPGASLEKVKSVYAEQGLWPAAKEVVSEIPAAIAEQAPNLGATFAGARLGSVAGAPFGPWGAGAGALLGAAVPSFFSQAGSNLERQAQEGKPVSRTSAFGTAAPQAAIDVFADKFAFGKLLGLSPAKLGTEAAEKLAGQSMKRVLATGVAKGIAAEVPGEVAQQMLERFQAGLPLTDDDARKEYANVMYQTALTGPVGALSNIQERGAAREQYAQEQQQLQSELAAIDAERARQQAIVEEAQATANAVAAEESRKILADLDFRAQKLKEAEAISTAQPLRPLQEIIDEVNGVSTPRTKVTKASVNAALNEPSGQRVSDANGVERELTMGELQQIQRPELAEPIAHPTLDKTTLTSLVPNLTPQAGVYKRLLNLDVDSEENLAKLRGELGKLGDKYAVNETKLKEIEDGYKQAAAERKTAESLTIEPGREAVGAGVSDLGGLGRGTADTGRVAGPDVGRMDVTGSPVSEPVSGTSGEPTALKQSNIVDAKTFTKALNKKANAFMGGFGEVAGYNYTTPEGVEVTLKDFEGPALDGILVDYIGSKKRGAGFASKELDSILDLATANDMPVGIRVDSAEATRDSKNKVGLTDKQLKDWYERKGFIFKKGSYFGYKPAPSEDANKYIEKTKTVSADEQSKIEAQLNKEYQDRTHSDSESFGYEFDSGRLKPGYHVVPGWDVETDSSMHDVYYYDGKNRPVRVNNVEETYDYNTGQSSITVKSKKSTALNPYQQKLADQRRAEEQARLEEKAANLAAAKAEQAAIAAQQATAEQRAAKARKVDEAQAQYDDAIQAAQEELPTVDERAAEPDVDIEKFEEAKDKFGTYLRQTFGNVKNIAPEEQISAGEALSALADIMYHIVRQGAKSTGHAIQQARKALSEKYGDVVKNITADQFNEAYTTAVNRRATEQVAPKATAAKPTGPVKTRADGTPIKYSMTPKKSVLEDVRKVFNGEDNDWSAFADGLGALRDKIGLGVVSKRYTLERKALDKGIPAVSAKQQGVMRGDLIAQQADNAVALSHAGMIKGDLQILPSGMVQAQDADTNMMTISDGYRALVQQAAKDLGSEDLAYDMVSAGWNGPRYASLARKNAEIDAQIATLAEEKPAHWRAQVTALENDKAYIGDWTESDKKTAAEAERRYGAQLKDIKDQWNDFRGRLLNTMVDSGLYTQAQADAYLENMDYVPFYRLTEDQMLDIDKLPKTGSSLRNLGKEFKLKGSEKTIADPLENLWANVSWMMQRAIKNNAALNLTSLIEQIGEGRFAESWSRNGHIGSLTDAEKKKLYHVVVSKDGEAKEFVVDDPNDMAAFSANPIITGAIWDLIGLPARGLRHGVTMMPQFVFNQAFEDPVRAAMVSGNKAGIMKNIKDTWTSIAKNQFTAEHSPGAEALYSAGVIGQKDIMSEQEVKDIYMGRNKQGWRKGLFFFERLAQGSDLGAREAIYNNAVEELVNEGYDRKTAESLALSRAIQYMPHQQVGTSRSLAYLRRMMPFVNSPIQGLARDVAAARGRISGVSKEEGKKRLAFRLAKYAAFTAMYAAFMSGDDDYETLTEDQKDNYFIIGGARIPAPQEIRPLKVLIERGTRAWVLNAPGADIESTDIAAASMKKAWELISGLAMPIPTAIRPVLENMTNYDIHSGRAVVGAGQAAREPAMQFTDGTSELAKSIGAAINYSPIKIDHLLSGYFGYAGQTVQNMTNMLASDRPAPSINELMFVGSIAAPEYGTGPKTEAYELLNKVAEVKATMKALREEGDAEKLREYMTKNRGYLGAEGLVNSMHTQITNIRRLQSMVAKSDMSPDEKRAKIDELKQNELASLSRVHEVHRMIVEANKEGS